MSELTKEQIDRARPQAVRMLKFAVRNGLDAALGEIATDLDCLAEVLQYESKGLVAGVHRIAAALERIADKEQKR